ncbi:hypothetical protein ACR9WD_03395 [Glutamicibacter sp. PAEs-4]|uniref:hypothetical protein n=1 Tax=Glutamicibacter sp. PAEs-4 TaxID=3444114 RepID=UPI003EB6A85B
MGFLDDKNNLWNQDHWSEMTKPIWKQTNINSIIDVMGASAALSASRLGSLDHMAQALASSQGTWGAVSEIHKQLDMSGISGALSNMSSVLDSIYGPKSSLLDGLGSLAVQGQTISSGLGANTALFDAAKSLTQTFALSESVVSTLGQSLASQASGLKGLANSLDSAPLWGGVDSWVTRFGAGMPGSEFAVSGLLPSDLDPSLLTDELLESAQAFEDAYGGTEVEEDANEFLNSHADIAAQVHNSEVLLTLTLKQRKAVAGLFSVSVYLAFVSMAVYGYVNHPGLVQILSLCGFAATGWVPLSSPAAMR